MQICVMGSMHVFLRAPCPHAIFRREASKCIFKFVVLSLFHFIYNESLRITFLRRCVWRMFEIISDETLPSAFGQLLLSSRHEGKPSTAMPDAGEPHSSGVRRRRVSPSSCKANSPRRLPPRALRRRRRRRRSLACPLSLARMSTFVRVLQGAEQGLRTATRRARERQCKQEEARS